MSKVVKPAWFLAGVIVSAAAMSFAWAEDAPVDVLKDLTQRYARQQQTYREALEKAKTPDDYQQLRDQDPRDAFVDDLLAIEKAHRGQPAAISALFHLISNAGGFGDPVAPASQGRIAAIGILREHYCEHRDLDLLLGRFTGGAFVPEAELLLRDAAKSHHAEVRAAGRYFLAGFLKHEKHMAEIYGPNAPNQDAAAAPGWAKIREKRREQVKAIDPEACGKEALALVEQLIAEQPDVVVVRALPNGRDDLNVHRTQAFSPEESVRTYAHLAEGLRFEMTRLQKGQVVPDISGKDADGLEFKLSDYRGRVVLLMFSANWCGPCKAMYPGLRELQAALADEPFAILAVMGDSHVDTVIDDTKRGDIRWRTWFDGDRGPIATTWNIHGWPTTYLIDHNGVIITKAGQSPEAIRKTVDSLLTARQADPSAAELLKAHPLPRLPILEPAE